jgi:peptide chain release factor 3
MRDIPILTFINKMDREAQDPLALLDEVARKLALDPAPLYWPAASGQRFAGMLDLTNDEFLPFRRGEDAENARESERLDIKGNSVAEVMDESVLAELRDGVELARAGLPEFDRKAYLEGHMTPVIFGSALRRYGVRELLSALGTHAPGPRPQKALRKGNTVMVVPQDRAVSGFVFKIQANMDPQHRDRVAFLRLTSGEFRRGMRMKTSTGKLMTVHNPLMFMAQDREIAETAYAGDVIGVPNHGLLRVGDSLSESGELLFAGIPNFAPEILRRARVKDPMKQKHLKKALEGLAEEGVTQLFRPALGSDLIVGAVGALQIDVMAERVAAEYGLEVDFEMAPFNVARWISSEDPALIAAFLEKNISVTGTDLDGAPVYLGKNSWDVGYAQEKNPGLRFNRTKERVL